MTSKKIEQKSGDNSTNIQVAGDVQFGMSYDDVRQIALDVFKANFYELSELAAKKAMDRAIEMTEKFLQKFFDEIPELLPKLEDPAVQYSIYNAQKEYARTGDIDLEKILLHTLIARINSEERSIKQIVLDEAISILPKLTKNQINILTLSLSASSIRYTDVNTLQGFDAFVNNALLAFFPESASRAEFTHLQYCGCFTLPMGGGAPISYLKLGDWLGARFKGLLTNGFTEEQFVTETNGMKISKLGDFVRENLRFPEKLQFDALFDQNFDTQIAPLNLSPEKVKLLKALWTKTAMKKEEVNQVMIQINPLAKGLINAWDNTILPAIQLTSVGVAIAVINFNQVRNTKLSVDAFL